MSTEAFGSESGDATEPASRRFRVDVVPAGRARRVATFLPSMAFALFGEVAPQWPPQRVRVVDRRTERCVFEPEGSGDTSDYAPVLRADLDRMSVEEFCEEWGIDPVGIGLPPPGGPPTGSEG